MTTLTLLVLLNCIAVLANLALYFWKGKKKIYLFSAAIAFLAILFTIFVGVRF